MTTGINKVILIGHLGKAPEIKTLNDGVRLCNLSLATSERWTNKQTGQAQEHTEWHRLVLSDRLAEIAEKYLQKGSMQEPVKSHTMDGDNFPAVTIQLPLFNEQYVAGRLIDNMVKMDYPRHKLQIQVLDDSTDETLDITKQKVKQSTLPT